MRIQMSVLLTAVLYGLLAGLFAGEKPLAVLQEGFTIRHGPFVVNGKLYFMATSADPKAKTIQVQEGDRALALTMGGYADPMSLTSFKVKPVKAMLGDRPITILLGENGLATLGVALSETHTTVSSAYFTPEGEFLFASGANGDQNWYRYRQRFTLMMAKESIKERLLSPDGESLAWIMSKKEGVMVAVNGQNSQSAPNVTAIGWSPDSRSFAYQTRNDREGMITYYGGNFKATVKSWTLSTTAGHTPRGELFYVSHDAQPGEVIQEKYYMMVGGRKFTTPYLSFDSICFTPDGKEMAYAQVRSVPNPRQDNPKAVSTQAQYLYGSKQSDTYFAVSHGQYSPDGKGFAFAGKQTDGTDVMVVNGKAGERMPGSSIRWMEWSPDSQRVAYTYAEGHKLWAIDGTVKVLTPGKLEPMFNPQTSKLAVVSMESPAVQHLVVDGAVSMECQEVMAIVPAGKDFLAVATIKGGTQVLLRNDQNAGIVPIGLPKDIIPNHGFRFVTDKSAQLCLEDGFTETHDQIGAPTWNAGGHLQFWAADAGKSFIQVDKTRIDVPYEKIYLSWWRVDGKAVEFVYQAGTGLFIGAVDAPKE